MTTLAWIVTIYLYFESATHVLTIGRPRKPRTAGEALLAIIVFGVIIAALATS